MSPETGRHGEALTVEPETRWHGEALMGLSFMDSRPTCMKQEKLERQNEIPISFHQVQ